MKVKVLTILTLAIALFVGACGGKSDADITKAATDGVATLTGEVADVTVKSRAEAAIKSVEGVKSVTNNTTTKPLPTPAPVVMDDKEMEGRIDAIMKKRGVEGVTVSVKDGEVTLSGKVAKEKVADAMMSANEINPKKVINNLNK